MAEASKRCEIASELNHVNTFNIHFNIKLPFEINVMHQRSDNTEQLISQYTLTET